MCHHTATMKPRNATVEPHKADAENVRITLRLNADLHKGLAVLRTKKPWMSLNSQILEAVAAYIQEAKS